MNKRRCNRAKDSSTPDRAGWRINEWCKALPCCRAQFYILAARDSHLIKTVHVGAMHIVLISPKEYLAAKAAEQGQATATSPQMIGHNGGPPLSSAENAASGQALAGP